MSQPSFRLPHDQAIPLILLLAACTTEPVSTAPTGAPPTARVAVPTATPVPTPTPVPTLQPIPIGVPNLQDMSAHTLRSASPDGQWRTEALLASFRGDTWHDYARLTVSPMDDSGSWMAYERLNEYGGLGSVYLSDFYWSADGRYLYFTHSGVGDGCGYRFTGNLHRVDLRGRTTSEIPLTDWWFGEITVSPEADRMAYQVQHGIRIVELAGGSARTIPLAWTGGHGYVIGWNAWSPDGQELAFSVTESLCDSPEPPRSAAVIIDLETGETRSPGRSDAWVYLPQQVIADPVPTATLALHEFLSSLYWAARDGLGDYTYESGAALYGGSYETLIEINPELDPEDHGALLRAACEINGYQCLRLRDVVSSFAWWGQDGAQWVFFTVYLSDADGGIFALGPCCGEEDGLPQTLFSFTVREAEDGGFKVLELPPYMP